MQNERSVGRVVMARDLPAPEDELSESMVTLLLEGWYIALDYGRVFDFFMKRCGRVTVDQRDDGAWCVTAGGQGVADPNLDRAFHRLWRLVRDREPAAA